MQDYKRGSHTIMDCKYHIVWVTKYRYPTELARRVYQRLQPAIRGDCATLSFRRARLSGQL